MQVYGCADGLVLASSYLVPFGIQIKYGTNMKIFRSKPEFHYASVCILTTSASNSEPILDFSENAKTDGSNVEKQTVRTGKNFVHFQRYIQHEI